MLRYDLEHGNQETFLTLLLNQINVIIDAMGLGPPSGGDEQEWIQVFCEERT